MSREELSPPLHNPWDGVVARFQELRQSAGNPSYEVIAQRITESREGAGVSPHAARAARSTVYDSLRPGRARLNVDFLYEIAEALGGTVADVDQWVRDAHRAPADELAAAPPTLRQALVLATACIAANLVGRVMVDVLHLPIYLDMVGTAIAAVALGPWRGAAVGATTNVVGAVGSGWVSIPFALVNVAGALVWGYGARRLRMVRTLPRFLLLNVLVATTCTLVAVPILVVVFGGSVGQGQDFITQTFLDLGNGLVAAVGFSNLVTSMGDKVISGFIALVVISSLPAAFRVGVEWVRIP